MDEHVREAPVTGVCVIFHNEEGWGVLSSPELDGEVWVHFSNIEMEGYKTLRAGQPVTFSYETPGFLHDHAHVNLLRAAH